MDLLLLKLIRKLIRLKSSFKIMTQLNQSVKILRSREKNIHCSFSFIDLEQKIKIDVKSPLHIDISKGLNEELGFKHTMFYLSSVGFAPKSFVSRQLENNLKCISALFIYCNIIDYQFIGKTYAPLLRTILVNVNSDNYGKYIDHIFSKPH